MSNYEYKYVSELYIEDEKYSISMINPETIESTLNSHGKEGWKLTESIVLEGRTVGFIFMRKLKDKEKSKKRTSSSKNTEDTNQN